MIKYFSLFITVYQLSSCAMPKQYVKFSEDDFLTVNNRAEIYVLRSSIIAGSISMKVYCNDKLIGKTGAKSYLSWKVREGEYVIKSVAENNASFTLRAQAGKTYYLKQVPTIGWLYSANKLKLISEEEAIPLLFKLRKPEIDTVAYK
jgi:hypothetical protein